MRGLRPPAPLFAQQIRGYPLCGGIAPRNAPSNHHNPNNAPQFARGHSLRLSHLSVLRLVTGRCSLGSAIRTVVSNTESKQCASVARLFLLRINPIIFCTDVSRHVSNHNSIKFIKRSRSDLSPGQLSDKMLSLGSDPCHTGCDYYQSFPTRCLA